VKLVDISDYPSEDSEITGTLHDAQRLEAAQENYTSDQYL